MITGELKNKIDSLWDIFFSGGLSEPLEVIDFHNFLARSYLVLTDSGGIQEEAPSLGKPVLVMRNTTDRPEGIEAGTLKLVGTDEQKIYESFKELLQNKEEYLKNVPFGMLWTAFSMFLIFCCISGNSPCL